MYLSTSQILTKLASYSKLATSTGNVITLGKALKKHNFQRIKKKGNYVYSVIELTSDQVDKENRVAPSEDETESQSTEEENDTSSDDLPF